MDSRISSTDCEPNYLVRSLGHLLFFRSRFAIESNAFAYLRPILTLLFHCLNHISFYIVGGSMVPDHLRSSRSYVLYAAVEAPCKTISESLCCSIQLLEDTINYGFDLPGASSSSVRPADLLAAYQKTHEDAASAVKLLKIQLSATHASLDRRRRSSPLAFREDPEDDEFSKEVFAISLYTVSLLQVCLEHLYPHARADSYRS